MTVFLPAVASMQVRQSAISLQIVREKTLRQARTRLSLVCLIVFGDNGMQARGDFIARTVFIVLCLFTPGQINDAVAIALHSFAGLSKPIVPAVADQEAAYKRQFDPVLLHLGKPRC